MRRIHLRHTSSGKRNAVDPDVTEKNKKLATLEMEAFERLPPELQNYLRESKVGWRSAVVEKCFQEVKNVRQVIYLMKHFESGFNHNQVPAKVTVPVIAKESRG